MQNKKLRAKEGNQFKSSFFGAGVVVSAKHISSTPKGESSSTVELQIGGVAAPELVWWSRSPPKHVLNVQVTVSLFSSRVSPTQIAFGLVFVCFIYMCINS
jgi:hypothetical protein